MMCSLAPLTTVVTTEARPGRGAAGADASNAPDASRGAFGRPENVPRVLLVTGADHPEISAAGVQCRAVAAALGGRARFSVLTTAVNPALAAVESVDDVVVYRVHVDVRSRASKAGAMIRFVGRLLRGGARVPTSSTFMAISQKNSADALARACLANRSC